MTDTTATAGSGENMSNEQMNALIIENAVHSYWPVITEWQTKTIEDDGKPLMLPLSPEEKIAEAKQFIGSLTIAGIDDKQNYKIATQVKSKITKWRTGIERKRKELKAVALEYGRAVDGEAKRLTELIVPLEADITAKIDAIDKAAEAAKKAEQLRRHKLLTENGWQFTGTWYICGILNITADQLSAGDEDTLAGWIDAGLAEVERKEAERIRKDEEARKAAEEAARLAEENARKDAEIAEMKAKLAAMEAAQKPKPEPVQEPELKVHHAKAFPKALSAEAIVEYIYSEGKEPIDVLGTAVIEPEQVRTEKQTVPGWSHPAPTPEFTAPRVGSVTTFDYSEGFEDCRRQVLAIMQDPTPRKRADFIQAFTELAPSK